MTAKRSRGEAEEGETIKTANLLMLLSQVGESTNSIITVPSDRVFKCKTCNKQFHTFQALGGHRASHKKIKLVAELLTQPSNSRRKAKKHECPICGLEFAMGQALGGHMRRHRAAILEETKGLEIDNKSQPQKMAPAVFLMRSNSSKRVFGLDLNLLPYENDLEQRIKTPTPLLNCFI